MIMNEINLVLFSCIIHVIFFEIQLHNYFVFVLAVPQPTVPPGDPDEALHCCPR